jgi:hypothetical protein
MLDLNDSHAKTTGSLLRCSNCDFIFMVNRLGFAEEPIAEDTNVDQSILADLYNTRHNVKPNCHSMKSLINRMLDGLGLNTH